MTATGITRGTTAAHFARAALQSIAFQVADVLDVMRKDSDITISELRVDGGAAANDLLLQFQADLLRVPVAALAEHRRRRWSEALQRSCDWEEHEVPASHPG